MLYLELAPYNIQVKTIAPGVVKTNFVMEHLPTDEYNEMIKKQIELLVPDQNIETAEEVAIDVYNSITDSDKDRMTYASGKVAKELYDKKQKMGADEFRRYVKNF